MSSPKEARSEADFPRDFPVSAIQLWVSNHAARGTVRYYFGVTAPDSQVLHNLTDDDILVRPLAPAASALALTGIELRGFERLDAIPILEWKVRRRKRTTTLATEAS
jgi:hypothetical protein